MKASPAESEVAGLLVGHMIARFLSSVVNPGALV